jgi:hypothetical protein
MVADRPNHMASSAIQPFWSGWSRKGPAFVLSNKTIAIAKGLDNCDRAPARSILPRSELFRTPLEGPGIRLMFNPIWARIWPRVICRRHFNHGGGSGTLERTTVESWMALLTKILANTRFDKENKWISTVFMLENMQLSKFFMKLRKIARIRDSVESWYTNVKIIQSLYDEIPVKYTTSVKKLFWRRDRT